LIAIAGYSVIKGTIIGKKKRNWLAWSRLRQKNDHFSGLRVVRHDHPDRRAWSFHQAPTAE
jgi:hypothetical protein